MDKSLLGNPDPIYNSLQKVLYSEDHNLVRTTALNLLKQYWRYFESETKGCQTNDDFIEAMNQDIIIKTKTIVL